MDIVTILVWLLVGAFVGWLAGMIMGSRLGFIGNAILGLIGGAVGGLIARALNISTGVGLTLTDIVLAVIGAVIVIAIVRVLRRA
jgi:uncharacterized membrane protein YeaQ/YmgE (transglycosylase-associated protein family)